MKACKRCNAWKDPKGHSCLEVLSSKVETYAKRLRESTERADAAEADFGVAVGQRDQAKQERDAAYARVDALCKKMVVQRNEFKDVQLANLKELEKAQDRAWELSTGMKIILGVVLLFLVSFLVGTVIGR